MKRKKNRIPKYITTVAPYHDKNKNIVRITQVTVETSTDNIVFEREYLIDDGTVNEKMEQLKNYSIEFLSEVNKFHNNDVRFLDESLDLEQCNCGCGRCYTVFMSLKYSLKHVKHGLV